jgi:hypothetical protein
MVAISEQNTQNIICPECGRPLPNYTIFNVRTDRYGRRLRNYFGQCSECNCRFEVVQFRQDGCWHIHKFRYYAFFVKAGKTIPQRHWTIENELPAAPPLVIGPGGDYVRMYRG